MRLKIFLIWFMKQFNSSITKPTRLTCYSKTIIDNILTNNFKEYLTHEPGFIFSTISDHFPVYHICRNIKVTSTTGCFTWKRRKNLSMIAFKNDIDNHSWEYVMISENTKEAYELFHNKITQFYERHFPYRKIKLNKYKKTQAMAHWSTRNSTWKEDWFIYEATKIGQRNSQKSIFGIQK